MHRLNRKVNSKFKNTIVRFVNRKDAFRSLNYKKNLALCGEKLGIYKLFMVETCVQFIAILWTNLKRTGELYVWSQNGIVTFKKSHNSYPIKLLHEEDYTSYFPKDHYLDEYNID